MGHKSLETTMVYLQAEALSVYSPLDALPVILPGLEKGSVSSMDCYPAAPLQPFSSARQIRRY
jgi:hypothetical protein